MPTNSQPRSMRALAMVVLVGSLALSHSEAVGTRSFTIETSALRKHIATLADDKLEGRRVGTDAEQRAAKYIGDHFAKLGLTPAGDNGTFAQAFEFISGAQRGPNNVLTIADRTFTPDSDFVPLDNSKSGPFGFDSLVFVGFGIEHDSMNHHDYAGRNVKGRAVLISRFAPDGDDPHGPYANSSSLDAKISEAIKREVAGIFFITPADQDDALPESFGVRNVIPKDIPIVFLRHRAYDSSLSPEKIAESPIRGVIDITIVKDTGYNVIGLLPSSKSQAGSKEADSRIVVIGGHYDHLGWGGRGSGSLYAGKEPQIHNGADDNASGTAGVMELARAFTAHQKDIPYSILFMAFSGEEAGLLGSKYFVEHPTVDTAKIDFMVNMDMIGRLDTTKGLTVLGVGTSPPLKEYFEKAEGAPFKIGVSESGVAPSDNTAFYNHGIPVMFFFTGSHSDYHKPSDDADKVNYEGEADVLRYVAATVDHFAGQTDKLAFTKTKSDNPTSSPRFSVTLGVMPDYTAQVKGLRVDGVTDGRPAANAGVVAGDVIVKLGDYPVEDIQGYMFALSKFRKGESTILVVERNGAALQLPVTF